MIGRVLVVGGLVLIVLSLVLAAIFGDHPQRMDDSTTAGYLVGVGVFAVGVPISVRDLLK